jgi:hypothetical protein
VETHARLSRSVMLPEIDVGNPSVSEAMKQELVRSVSKNGDFLLAQAELDALAGSLEDAEVISLYEYIRDNSMRLEGEWRDEFIEAFPEQESLLPEPLA